jgi:hypothetical protein
MPYKKPLILLAIIAISYFLLLPVFWPKPEISVYVPSSSNIQSDIEATVIIQTWHSNFSLFSVNGTFEVDKNKNNGNSIVALSLLPKIDDKKWNSDHTLGINRWSWPRTFEFIIKIPFQELHDLSSSNYVIGRIRIKLRYPDVSLHGFVLTNEETHVENIKIEVLKNEY